MAGNKRAGKATHKFDANWNDEICSSAVVVADTWRGLHSAEESIQSLICWKYLLWSATAETDKGLDDPTLFSGARILLPDATDITNDRNHDARVAAANYRYMQEQWQCLFGSPLWDDIDTYPPASVMQNLFRSEFGYDFVMLENASFMCDGDRGVINYLDDCRAEGIAIVQPTIAMFGASLAAAGYGEQQPPAPRNYDPTDSQLSRGLEILNGIKLDDVEFKNFKAACAKKEFRTSVMTLRIIFNRWKNSKA